MRRLLEFVWKPRIQVAGTYLSVRILQSGISLAVIPISTRYLTPEQYGIVMTCGAISSAIGVFAFLCVQESAYFAVIQRERDAPAKVASVLAFELVMTALLLTLLFLLTCFTNDLTVAGIRLFPYIFFVAVASMASGVVTLYLLTLQATDRVRTCVLVSFVIFLAATSLQLFFLLVPKLDALSYVYAQAIVNGTAALFALAALTRTYGFRPSAALIRQSLAFSLPLVAHNGAHWLRESSDRILLSTLGSTSQTGIYGLAVTYSSVLSMAVEAFRLTNNPRFFSLIPAALPNRKRITGMLPASLAALSGMAILMSVVAKDFFRLLLAPAYWDSYRYVPLITVSILTFTVYLNVVNVLFHAKRTGLLGIATAAGSLVGVAMSWQLVSRFGIWGCATGLLGTNVCITLVVLVFAQRQLHLPWPWMPTFLCVVAPLGCYLGGMLDRWHLVVRLTVASALIAVLATVGVRYFRTLSQPCDAPDAALEPAAQAAHS